MSHRPFVAAFLLVGASCTAFNDLPGPFDGGALPPSVSDASTEGGIATADGSVGPPPGDGSADGSAGSDGSTPPDPAAAYRALVLADSPVAYYPLDEPTGSRAFDATPHHNDCDEDAGIVHGALGIFGTHAAVSTDGTGAKIDCGDRFDFATPASFSLEGWVKPTIVDNKYRKVFSTFFDAASRGGFDLDAHLETAPTLRWERYESGSTVGDTLKAPLTLNAFHHVVAMFDGGLGQAQIYLDGSLVVAKSWGAASAHPGPFMIAAQADNSEFWAGTLDELAIYDRALPAATVAAHFRAGSGH